MKGDAESKGLKEGIYDTVEVRFIFLISLIRSEVTSDLELIPSMKVTRGIYDAIALLWFLFCCK